MYINEICEQISFCNIKLYADDAKIYSATDRAFSTFEVAQDLQSIEWFLYDWQLKLNADKCEVMHIGRNNPLSPYYLNGEQLRCVESCSDLGVRVSNELSVRLHCTTIARNASYRLKQLNTAFVCKERSFKVHMFKTYVRPLLEYNAQVWSPSYLNEIDTVERVQRRFSKFMPGLWEVPYLTRLQILGLESLELRRIVFDLVYMYKLVYGFIDVDFTDLFISNTRVTRGHDLKVRMQRCNVNCRKHFFCNRVSKIWNSLPHDVVSSSSVDKFKSKLGTIDLSVYCKGRAYTV